MTITYKRQGDGRNSWLIVDNEDKYMMYTSPANHFHNEMMKQVLENNNYLTIGEVALWVNDPVYGAEANNIIAWWTSTCKMVEAYVITNPEETDCVQFLSTIPKYTNTK